VEGVVGYVLLSAACNLASVFPKFKYKRLLGLVLSIVIESSWQMLRSATADGLTLVEEVKTGFLVVVRRGFNRRESEARFLLFRIGRCLAEFNSAR